MPRLLLTAASLALAACASQPQPSAQNGASTHTIAVALAVPPADATRRVVEAFVAQGYAVASESASGSVVTTQPFKHDPATDVVLTANVVGADGGGSRVTLSAAYSVPSTGVRNEPAAPGGGRRGAVWRRVEAVAEALRQ